MKIIIIGLGIYGSNLARDLTALGNEIIGVDNDTTAIERVKDYISTVYQLDTTDDTQVGVLPLKSADLVVVAIGENFGASVRTVAILKKMSVKHIYARAIDPLHKSILECFDIERILTPEQRAASDLTIEMMLGSAVETLSVDENRSVVKFTAPENFVGLEYTAIKPLSHRNITLIAATRPESDTNLIGVKVKKQKPLDIGDPELKVEAGDVLTCLGNRKDFRNLIS